MRTSTIGEDFWRDVRFAVRIMRKNPVFVVTSVLTLTLAIGGTTAMFAVIRAVLMTPLRYPHSNQLVRVLGSATPTRYSEMRTGAASLAQIGAYTNEEDVTLSGRGEPEVLKGAHVSGNFLDILRTNPIRGRSFSPDEDAAGGPAVAMISADLWQRRFGSDPQIVGSSITLDAEPHTIIGVLPAHLQFPSAGLDVWRTAPSELPTLSAKSRALSPFLNLFGRLKPGVTLRTADTALRVIHRQYAIAHPAMLDAKPKKARELAPLKDELVGDVRETLWILFGAVAFVLLIACANVASLLLTRGKGREREFAVRSSLGAPPIRLIRQLLAESLLLSVLGGTIGLVFAALVLRTIPHMVAFQLPRQEEISVDWLVLAFAGALALGTGLLFGLVPAFGISRPDLAQVLRASGEGLNRGVSRPIFAVLHLRGLLLTAQVALSVVLLIGAALLIRSVGYLRHVEVGFDSANLLTVNVSLPPLRYETDRKIARFFDEASNRVSLLPGVRSAAVAMSVPMTSYPGIPVQDAAKPQRRLNERLIAKYFPVTPGYFRTLGIALKRGREFSERDTDETERVAIIDENLAHRFWPAYPAGLDPVGQHLWVGSIKPRPARIIGVVADISQDLDSSEDWAESVYVSFAQNPVPSAILVLRTQADPLSFTGAIREQIHRIDPAQPIGATQSMEDLMEDQVGQRRLVVTLLGSFASMALLLALIGIYGVAAYSVVQRIPEIGIRRALGASTGDILRLVLGEGALLAAAGILMGLGGALALTRLMSALLFHVRATDPVTFIGVALLFLIVASAASLIPARRAIRINAAAALRA